MQQALMESKDLSPTKEPIHNQESPLANRHSKLGGKMVPFAGWNMPVQYGGILEEHRAVRSNCGIFDISHMGEFFVKGDGAKAWLNGLLTNNVDRIAPMQSQYTLLLNENGGVIDDLIVYQIAEDSFLLIVNAAKVAEDAAWMQAHLPEVGVAFSDRSLDYAAVAVQGPESARIYEVVFNKPMPEKNQMQILDVDGHSIYVGGTGYTGESGFEIFMPLELAESIWDRLIAAGAKPCGLGARDTLRLEMCYPLNGADLSPARTPLEAGLGVFVDLEKETFVGRDQLLRQKAEGIAQRLCAIKIEEKSPPARAHYGLFVGEKQIAETTSGALSPSLGYGIAMAYLPAEYAKPGQSLKLDIRGRLFQASVVRKPFIKAGG